MAPDAHAMVAPVDLARPVAAAATAAAAAASDVAWQHPAEAPAVRQWSATWADRRAANA